MSLKHFKNLYRIARKKGIWSALTYDARETSLRSPILSTIVKLPFKIPYRILKGKPIEKIVGERVGEYIADKARDYFANVENLEALDNTIVNSLENVVNQVVESGELEESKKERFKDKWKRQAKYSFLRQTLKFKQALWGSNTEEVKEELESEIELAKIKGEEVPQELETAYQTIERGLRQRDKVVEHLVEKAKQEGFNKATTPYAIDQELKTTYSNSDDLVKFSKNIGLVGINLASVVIQTGELSKARKLRAKVLADASKAYFEDQDKGTVGQIYQTEEPKKISFLGRLLRRNAFMKSIRTYWDSKMKKKEEPCIGYA